MPAWRAASWRAASYALLRGGGRALELAGRASIYLAVGTLRLGELRASIAGSWGVLGGSDDVTVSGLMPWEHALYERFLAADDRILMVGCGAGRDLIALLKLGYRVEGIDVASGAIEAARRLLAKEGLFAELSAAAIETAELSGRFDAVIFSWCCYSFIPLSAARVSILRKVAAHLSPGGKVIVSYIPAERPLRALPIRLTRLAGWLTRSDWWPERGDVFRPAGDRRAVHYEHQFVEGEFEREAGAAGLMVGFHHRADVAAAVLTTV